MEIDDEEEVPPAADADKLTDVPPAADPNDVDKLVDTPAPPIEAEKLGLTPATAPPEAEKDGLMDNTATD
jgi:hypothetical protein